MGSKDNFYGLRIAVEGSTQQAAKQAAPGNEFFWSASGAHFRRALTLLGRQCLERLRKQAMIFWAIEVEPPDLQIAITQLWKSLGF